MLDENPLFGRSEIGAYVVEGEGAPDDRLDRLAKGVDADGQGVGDRSVEIEKNGFQHIGRFQVLSYRSADATIYRAVIKFMTKMNGTKTFSGMAR